MADCDGDIPKFGANTPASVVELTECFARQSVPVHGAPAVEHIETHLSHVFLCGEFVYKILKPLKFAFVDFSTLDRRMDECRAEVELNRRLAGEVYLAAVRVVRLPDGEIRIDESGCDQHGKVVDWAIKMRRLPAEQTLEERIRRGEGNAGLIEDLVHVLARHYAAAERPRTSPADYLAAIERHVRDNLAELSRGEHGLPRSLVERQHAAQLTTLALYRTEFEQRVNAGRIVLGHGDLRPEHVYFTPKPVIIDCLAFSEELRTLDVADEIAFLAMELRRIGSESLAEGLLGSFETQSGDHPSATIWAFYQAYRACVRAKVAVLRAAQMPELQCRAEYSLSRSYLDLADAISKPFAEPFCLIVRGLSGTGKSTLAAALADKLGIAHLQTDQIRKQLFPSATASGYGQGCYTSAARKIVYDAMRAQAGERLSDGQSVILDGTFLCTRSRTAIAEMAGRLNVPLLVLECRCPVEIAAERLATRANSEQALSDANASTLKRQRDEEEPNPPGLTSVLVDTTERLTRQLETSFRAIRESLDACRL